MKKTLAILLALVMMLGCASALAELTFTTGGPAGTYYAFGNVLAQGVIKGIHEQGFLGIFVGGAQAAAGGITASIVFGFLAALLFKPKIKS